MAKKVILDAHAAAREAEANPAAQAAARAIGQAASTIHSATHSLGLPLYGSLAIAYDRIDVQSRGRNSSELPLRSAGRWTRRCGQ